MANLVPVEKAYEYVKDLGLASEFPFADFKKYYDEKLQDNYRCTEGEEVYYLWQFLDEQKRAVSVDWKWIPRDLLYGVKTIFPEFAKLYKIILEEEDNQNKVWNLKLRLGEQTLEMKPAYEDPQRLVAKINEVLKGHFSKMLLRWDDGMDSFAYIVIPAAEYNRLAAKYPGP